MCASQIKHFTDKNPSALTIMESALFVWELVLQSQTHGVTGREGQIPTAVPGLVLFRSHSCFHSNSLPLFFFSWKLCDFASLHRNTTGTARRSYTYLPQRNFCCCLADSLGQNPSCGTADKVLCQLSDFCCSLLCQFWPQSSLSSSLLQWCEIADLRVCFFLFCFFLADLLLHECVFQKSAFIVYILCLCAPKARPLIMILLNKQWSKKYQKVILEQRKSC